MDNKPSEFVVLEFGAFIEIDRVADELTVIDELLELDGKDILDLGCGRGENARAIAETGFDRRVFAIDVDEVQHAVNLKQDKPSNLSFEFGGAEAIPADDDSLDVVLLFKSLHHVPLLLMASAFDEIARVLRPGGFALVSEPLFRGEFNEVLRIFHDEELVRRKAFEAVLAAVQSGKFELVSQTFLRCPLSFASFDEFDERVIRVTHTSHVLADEVLEEVRSTFARYAKTDGAQFEQPVRIDLLRPPLKAAIDPKGGSSE
ncbi:MAG: class I SAM-dependent methyltransferase [Planctomycetota bacterium]